MRNARSAIEISAFILLGTLLTLAWTSFQNPLTGILVLIAIPIGLFLITIFPRVVRNAASVIRSLNWWQVLWLLVFTSGLVFRDRDVHNIEANPVDAWALFRIALTGTTGAVLVLRLALRQTPWLQKLGRGLIAPLGAYCLVCLASSIWSVYPAWTLYKSVEFLVDVAVLAAIITTIGSAAGFKVFFDWTWILQGLLLGSVWISLLVWPHDALLRSEGLLGFELSGVMPVVNPNDVGELGAIIGVVAFGRLLRHGNERFDRLWYGLLLGFALLSMCLAQARSAILGFGAGTLLILFLSGRTGLSLFLAFASAAGLSVRNAVGTLTTFMSRGETQDQLYTLSNRLDWWTFAWPKILEHPLLGYGAFAGARFFVMAEYKIDAGIHSDWLEILVGTGLWGFIPALLVFLITWRRLIKSVRDTSLSQLERQLTIEALGVLGVLSVRSIFSPAMFGHPPVVFFAILGYAEFLRIRERRRLGNLKNPVLLYT